MSLRTKIFGGTGCNELSIGNNGEISAYIIPTPPPNVSQQTLPFSEFMKLNGTGTTSFVADGSTTNKDFHIAAKSYDVYINNVLFVIADAGATLEKFGALAALTNGFDFYYFNSENGSYVIESGIKTNFDFMKLANMRPAYGNANDALKLTNAFGASETYVGVIDFEDVFGMPWGMKLRANSTDRLGFILKDNIQTIDLMTVKVYGIRVGL